MIATEGYPTLVVVLLFSALVSWGVSGLPPAVHLPVWIVLGILCLLTLWFFRDPNRTPPEEPDLILAPADGEVVLIREVEEESYIGGKATQISIFLSPL